MRRRFARSAALAVAPAAAIVAALATMACEDLRTLQTLHRGLVEEFGTQQIGVNVNNGTMLTITFQNLRLPDTTRIERQRVCRRAAEFVRDHYADYPKLERINIAFSQNKDYGPMHVVHSDTPCTFRPRDLGPTSAPSDSVMPSNDSTTLSRSKQ